MPIMNGPVTDIRGFVQGQFAEAQRFANDAQEQCNEFLEVLNGAAAYAVPTISMDWETIQAPEPLTPLPPVELDDVVYEEPADGPPAEITIDPVELGPMTFGVAAPTTDFPAAPELDIGTMPTIPAVGAVAMPSAPTVTMPDTPGMLSLSIPTFAGLDLHEDWLSKFDDIPTLELVEPTPYSYSVGPEYTSALLTALQQVITTRLGGGTGLDPAVEQAIWDRARSRETQIGLANEAEIMRNSEALGFHLPTGVLAAQLREAQQNYYDKLSGLSRDIAIKQADLEQENLKQAIEQGIALEAKLIDYSYQLERLTFESAKEIATNAIAINNTMVEQHKALLSTYQIYESAYRTMISAELAKVDVFKSLIAAEQAKADINRVLIEQYKAQIEASMTQVEIFKAEVGAAKTLVEIEGLKISAAGEQIKAFVATINAETAKVEAYKAGIEAEASKVQVYKVKADVFATEAGVQIEAAKANIAGNDARVRAKALEWDGYKAKLELAKYVMQGVLQKNEQLLTQYKAESDVEIASFETTAKLWEIQIKDYEASRNLMLQTAKINGDLSMHAASVRADAAKVGAQVYAQLAGSAYSMARVSADLGYKGDLGVRYNYENITENQPPGIFE
jgi:hypothetical protein